MLGVIAILGWLLFIGALFLVWVAMRTSAKETNALALFGLAVLLSDEARNAHREVFLGLFEERRGRQELRTLVSSGIDGVTTGAKESMVSSMQVVAVELRPYATTDTL